MASHFDQENQLPSAQLPPSRFGLRKESGQPKLGLSIVNPNAVNNKKLQSQQPAKKVVINVSAISPCSVLFLS